MMPVLHIVFTDDWEIRGNGSGDPERMQFQAMRDWRSVLEGNGFRATFMVEIMQQLKFRQLQERHQELKEFADVWDASVTEAYRAGHDIQLHVHPQWSEAEYHDHTWKLAGDWSLLKHAPADVAKMIREGKAYLERLLRPLNRDYACVVFRAGAWCFAPSPTTLRTLGDLGFQVDVSIVGGLYEHTPRLSLDYRNVQEDFLPFSPRIDDARLVSSERGPVVCVPTHRFRGARFHFLRRDLKLIMARVGSGGHARNSKPSFFRATPAADDDWADLSVPRPLRTLKKAVTRYVSGENHVSDIAHLDYPLLRRMFHDICRRANETGLAEVPVVLTNHTKDMRNFGDVERFLRDLSQRDDVRSATGTSLARMLCEGRFPVRTAAPASPSSVAGRSQAS